ncbi:MAG: carbohydrate kinase family protein [Candidatus Komeilibacteria bacterium]|nr:carbohydrate kinase family protein [Candidatus Komeilibacteria bacterium]
MKANNNKKVLVSGSIVYDRIMVFPGLFKDHILPNQTHILNVSFTLQRTDESFGGTAGNIAYNLSLLREPATLLGLVGHDFSRYGKWLKKNKIDFSKVNQSKNDPTASAYIMTDKADNQITGFYPGPMDVKYCSLVKKIKNPSLAIVSPDFKTRMIEYVRLYKEMGVDYIFDPGQQVTSFTAPELRRVIKGAKVLIGNDYEIKLILNKLKLSSKKLEQLVDILIVTKGAQGSEIYSSEGRIAIAAVKVKNIIDPTGAGDAYRAGLIKGLISGASLQKAGQLASTIAAYAVEKQGTQVHKFTLKEFTNRYKQNYETSR